MGSAEYRVEIAVGETPNIAARVQGQASPNDVVISAATARLAEELFQCQTLGAHSLKGLSAPVTLYRVLQESDARSRVGAGHVRSTPFVGRQQELGLLHDRWEQIQEGIGQTMLISGEVGYGKSRLLQRFGEELATTAHIWRECHCAAYTQTSPLYPVVELLDRHLGLTAQDSPADKVGLLEQELQRADLPLAETLPLFTSLFSVPLPECYARLQLSPELQRQKLLSALISLHFRAAARRPMVLVFEDLQWADASTLELLAQLIEQNTTTRALVLCTYRPDFQPPWPTRSHITPIILGRNYGNHAIWPCWHRRMGKWGSTRTDRRPWSRPWNSWIKLRSIVTKLSCID